jgi:hypothetical protein
VRRRFFENTCTFQNLVDVGAFLLADIFALVLTGKVIPLTRVGHIGVRFRNRCHTLAPNYAVAHRWVVAKYLLRTTMYPVMRSCTNNATIHACNTAKSLKWELVDLTIAESSFVWS